MHNLHDLFQSAYRNGHSMETALLYVYNDLLCAIDGKKCGPSLLDLSAAFDTINHMVLLQRFELASLVQPWNGLLQWGQQFAHLKVASSHKHPLITGMSEGSVIGLFGFPTYQTPMGRICSAHGVRYHLYADDIQIYMTFDLPDGAKAVASVVKCIVDVSEWVHKNFLKLSNSKTEFIVIGSKHNLKEVENVSKISIGDNTV